MEPYNEALSPKMVASGINVKQVIEGSLRQMEDLLSLHRKNKNNNPVDISSSRFSSVSSLSVFFSPVSLLISHSKVLSFCNVFLS
jgi:hypothetical protein